MTILPLPSITLEPRHHALFLDIDGTLLDFASTPELVVVPPKLVQNLMTIRTALGGALALISGRTLENIDALFASKFPAAGVHGAQWRLGDAVQYQPHLPQSLIEDVFVSFQDMPALTIEEKECALAVHYRAIPAGRAAVLQRLTHIMAAHSDSGNAPLRIIDGYLVAEITSSETDKGRALRRYLEHAPFFGRCPIFLGDDTTDLSAIAAAQDLGGHGLRVGVAAGLPPNYVRAWIKRETTRLRKKT